MPAGATATPAVAKKRQPSDLNRVDLTDAWEVQYRRKQFGCTELQLRQAVAAVGDAVDKVKLRIRPTLGASQGRRAALQVRCALGRARCILPP